MIIHVFKGNYTFYKTRENKIIVVHWQTECGMLRAAKAGNQPEHTMEELWDKAKAERGKDEIGNHWICKPVTKYEDIFLLAIMSQIKAAVTFSEVSFLFSAFHPFLLWKFSSNVQVECVPLCRLEDLISAIHVKFSKIIYESFHDILLPPPVHQENQTKKS